MRPIKCGIVGDGGCGKTSISIGFTSDAFFDEYVPTVFDNFAKNMVVDGVNIALGITDTAGQAEYEKFRPECYPNTDVFLIIFSLVNRQGTINLLDIASSKSQLEPIFQKAFERSTLISFPEQFCGSCKATWVTMQLSTCYEIAQVTL